MIDLSSKELHDKTLTEQIIKVDPKQTPVRLDKFIFDKVQGISRNRIQNSIKRGTVLVNDEPIKSNYKIRPLDVIKLIYEKPVSDSVAPIPQDIPLDIRYEDDDLMVIHKPAGMVVHPGIGNYSGTLVNALAYHYGDLPVAEGDPNNRLGLVHRIDKGTSGLLVIAKKTDTLTHLAKQFYNHTIYRRYWALVWGEPDPLAGTVTTRIGRNPKDRKKMCVYDEAMEGGKHSITHYKVIEQLYYVSLAEFNLETGRTHQIRVHTSHLGNPIFGDTTYGGDKIMKGTVFSKYKQFVFNLFKVLPRQALHAKSLGFIHPTTGEEMVFHSELPEDFQTVLDKWRKYVNSRKEHLG